MHIYRWHSVNIIPTVAICALCSDDEELVHDSTCLEIVVFGIVMTLNLPLRMPFHFSMPHIGPLWSRKRKCWYFAKYKCWYFTK